MQHTWKRLTFQYDVPAASPRAKIRRAHCI